LLLLRAVTQHGRVLMQERVWSGDAIVTCATFSSCVCTAWLVDSGLAMAKIRGKAPRPPAGWCRTTSPRRLQVAALVGSGERSTRPR
jgi:hypothetical protein